MERINKAPVFKNNIFSAGSREFNVVGIEQGDLFCLFCSRVVAEQVHDGITVREKVNICFNPHGKNILGIVSFAGGYVFQLRSTQLVYPDIICLSAFVILPGPEFAKHAVQGKELAIG